MDIQFQSLKLEPYFPQFFSPFLKRSFSNTVHCLLLFIELFRILENSVNSRVFDLFSRKLWSSIRSASSSQKRRQMHFCSLRCLRDSASLCFGSYYSIRSLVQKKKGLQTKVQMHKTTRYIHLFYRATLVSNKVFDHFSTNANAGAKKLHPRLPNVGR